MSWMKTINENTTPALTKEQLKKIAPVRDTACDYFIPYLNRYAKLYNLTKEQYASFLAQILHESGCFKWVKEIWGNTKWQKNYERDFRQPWNSKLKKSDRNYTAYNLGNAFAGDGKFFMGRGPLMITGRKNYSLCSQYLFTDDRLLRTPQLLEAAEYGIAASFWWCFVLKKLGDEFQTPEVEDETRIINGSRMLGLEERKEFKKRAMLYLG